MKNIDKQKKHEIIFYVFLFLIVLSMGLFNKEVLLPYCVNSIFFIAGLIMGFKLKEVGIIFLLSFGIFELYVMKFLLLLGRFDYVVLSDASSYAYAYIIFIYLLVVIATIYLIVYNLSDKVKMVKANKIIILLLYTISIVLIAILPNVIHYF